MKNYDHLDLANNTGQRTSKQYYFSKNQQIIPTYTMNTEQDAADYARNLLYTNAKLLNIDGVSLGLEASSDDKRGASYIFNQHLTLTDDSGKQKSLPVVNSFVHIHTDEDDRLLSVAQSTVGDLNGGSPKLSLKDLPTAAEVEAHATKLKPTVMTSRIVANHSPHVPQGINDGAPTSEVVPVTVEVTEAHANKPVVWVDDKGNNASLAYEVTLHTKELAEPFMQGEYTAYLDNTGKLLDIKNNHVHMTGYGQVYDNNPIATPQYVNDGLLFDLKHNSPTVLQSSLIAKVTNSLGKVESNNNPPRFDYQHLKYPYNDKTTSPNSYYQVLSKQIYQSVLGFGDLWKKPMTIHAMHMTGLSAYAINADIIYLNGNGIYADWARRGHCSP